MRKYIIVTVLLLLFLLPGALALGISPSRTELDYAPGTVITLSYNIRGPANSDIEIIKQSELAPNIVVNGPNGFTLDAQGYASFSVTFTIPELSTPGLHEGLVGVQEGMPNAPGMTVARVAVLSQVWVRVPYPEKYLDFWFEHPPNVASGSVMPFTIKMTSRGSQTINHVSGVVEIFDAAGNSVALLPTTSADTLNFGDSVSITADWITTSARAGTYKAVATVNYDEKSKQLEGSFTVGEMIIEIVAVNASKFLPNTITKIPVIVTSKWNSPIESAYVTIDISKSGTAIAKLQTPSKTIQPWAADTLETYWDTNGLELGTYDANVNLYYADKSTSMKKKFSIVELITEEPEFMVSADTLMLIVLAIIVVAVAAAYMRKRGKRRNNWYGGR
ncbi:MAG: hypothetical protein V1839_00720 [archaeon]